MPRAGANKEAWIATKKPGEILSMPVPSLRYFAHFLKNTCGYLYENFTGCPMLFAQSVYPKLRQLDKVKPILYASC